MKEIHLEQGSADWLAWRAGRAYTDIFGLKHDALDGPRITATAASICGEQSPFATPHELWGEMVGLRKRPPDSLGMLRGSDMEPRARKAYCQIVGEDYEAMCIESSTTPWIAASLDGLDLLRTRGVEIKCPMSEGVHSMAMLGMVPPYYYDQIQWQHLAADNSLQLIDFFSFAPKIGKAAPIPVMPDLERQKQLLEASIKLRLAVMTRVPLSGREFEDAAKAYLVLNRRLKELEKTLEQAKDRLKKLADGKPMVGGGVMVLVSNNSGRTSYEKVAKAIAQHCQMSDEDYLTISQQFTGEPTKTITVKEASDADAIYQELVQEGATSSMTSTPTEQVMDQPSPTW